MTNNNQQNNAEQPEPVGDDISAMDTVRRILDENFSIYRGTYTMAILCMIVVSATTAFSAYIIKDVVNDVFDDKSLSAAYSLAGIILLIFFLKGIAGFGQDVLLNRIANNIVARYQARIYEHMLHLGVGFYNDTRSAYLVGQINQNISGIKNLLNQLISVFARDLLTFLGLVFVMIYMDPLMAFGSLFILPIAGYVLSRYVKRIKKLSRVEVDVNSRVAASMVETAQGISVVKAFTMEEQLQNKIAVLVKKAEKQANMIALVNARTRPLTETLGGLAIAGAVAFGGWRVISLGGDNGSLLAFLAAAMLAYDPARRLASFRVNFEKSLVNARMIYELLDTPPRQADKPGATLAKITAGNVVLKNISFSYGDGEQILHNVSFVAESGKTTALVGPSGGGKTTIVNLILRFYDPSSGTIEIDGQDICDMQIEGLRQHMALVSQQPVMFEGSIADNLLYARPDATMKEVEQAAKLAQAHDFILETPQGYDTPVGEMGSNLSGGQRQRLSIARALLRNARILLLDEATSALDNKSEKLVQNALNYLMKGRTTIVVAHRLSTIQNADKILVIDQGKIVEQGTHGKLLTNNSGIYADLHELGSVMTKSNTKPKAKTSSGSKARSKAKSTLKSGRKPAQKSAKRTESK